MKMLWALEKNVYSLLSGCGFQDMLIRSSLLSMLLRFSLIYFLAVDLHLICLVLNEVY